MGLAHPRVRGLARGGVRHRARGLLGGGLRGPRRGGGVAGGVAAPPGPGGRGGRPARAADAGAVIRGGAAVDDWVAAGQRQGPLDTGGGHRARPAADVAGGLAVGGGGGSAHMSGRGWPTQAPWASSGGECGSSLKRGGGGGTNRDGGITPRQTSWYRAALTWARVERAARATSALDRVQSSSRAARALSAGDGEGAGTGGRDKGHPAARGCGRGGQGQVCQMEGPEDDLGVWGVRGRFASGGGVTWSAWPRGEAKPGLRVLGHGGGKRPSRPGNRRHGRAWPSCNHHPYHLGPPAAAGHHPAAGHPPAQAGGAPAAGGVPRALPGQARPRPRMASP